MLRNLFGSKDVKIRELSSEDRRKLLNKKYPNPPRYIDPKEFHNNVGGPKEAIDTTEWSYVIPEFVVGVGNTGKWIHSSGGVLNNDDLVDELLKNENNLKEATIPTSGGRRRQRQTKVKSKKRANKRRTRSRK
jgi:hypothetical protein